MTRIMQPLPSAHGRSKHHPKPSQKREPKQYRCNNTISAKREKDERRDRQNGKMRRKSVFCNKLLHNQY